MSTLEALEYVERFTQKMRESGEHDLRSILQFITKLKSISTTKLNVLPGAVSQWA